MLLALLICALGAGSPSDGPTDVASQPEAASKLAFPRSETVEKRLILPTREQRATLEKRLGADNVPQVFQVWRARTGAHVDGYAVIDDVLGKSEPITYLLAVDPDLHVRAVEILAYRESRGGEVRQASWRAQFSGKDPSSALKVGSDIRNIAGATISCRAVTDGVRRELEVLDVLVGRDTAAASVTATSPTTPGSACSTSRDRTRLLMDSLLRIQVRDGDDETASAAIDAAFAEVARLEDVLSTWREATSASALNRNAGGEMLEVPTELSDLLATSVAFSRMTGGAFDITAGPIIELWRKSAKLQTWPDTEQIDAARARGRVDRARPRALARATVGRRSRDRRRWDRQGLRARSRAPRARAGRRARRAARFRRADARAGSAAGRARVERRSVRSAAPPKHVGPRRSRPRVALELCRLRARRPDRRPPRVAHRRPAHRHAGRRHDRDERDPTDRDRGGCAVDRAVRDGEGKRAEIRTGARLRCSARRRVGNGRRDRRIPGERPVRRPAAPVDAGSSKPR